MLRYLCGRNIEKKWVVKVTKDGTRTLAASSKVNLKNDAYRRVRKDSRSVPTNCTHYSLHYTALIHYKFLLTYSL